MDAKVAVRGGNWRGDRPARLADSLLAGPIDGAEQPRIIFTNGDGWFYWSLALNFVLLAVCIALGTVLIDFAYSKQSYRDMAETSGELMVDAVELALTKGN